MNRIIRTERLPLTVGQDVIQSILQAETPYDAAEIVAKYPCEEAVSIIDNLDPLTAAFILLAFNARVYDHVGTNYSVEYEQSVAAKAGELQIRGTLGLCDARDEVYRETGFLTGI